MPEALALMNSVLGLSAGAGLSPRRARYFSLLRQRKVPKRKATPSLRPLRGAKGQTCGVSVAGCAVELTALRCSFVQTSTASQFTKHGRFDAHATPQPPRRRRSQQGVDSRTFKQPNSRTSIRAIASLGPVCAARGACAREVRPSAAKARVAVRMLDVRVPNPLLAAPAAGRLRGEHGRRSAHASLTDSPWLSERRCAAAKRVPRRTPQPPRRRFAPSQREGVADWGSPFFWVLFFGEAKKSTSRAGRLPASALNKGMRPNQRPKENTAKTIATSAYPTSAPSQKHPKTTRRAHP